MEHDKQMPLRFEPSVFPSEAAPSICASQMSGLAAQDHSAAEQRTAVILRMHVTPPRSQATQERDSDLLGRILNRVKLF